MKNILDFTLRLPNSLSDERILDRVFPQAYHRDIMQIRPLIGGDGCGSENLSSRTTRGGDYLTSLSATLNGFCVCHITP